MGSASSYARKASHFAWTEDQRPSEVARCPMPDITVKEPSSFLMSSFHHRMSVTDPSPCKTNQDLTASPCCAVNRRLSIVVRVRTHTTTRTRMSQRTTSKQREESEGRRGNRRFFISVHSTYQVRSLWGAQQPLATTH
jgi:hypothetical protein